MTALPDADLLSAVHHGFRSPPGTLGYWATVRHAEQAAQVAEDLATQVRAGAAQTVIKPLACAIELLLVTMDRADDSCGALDSLLHRLLEAHAEACRQKPSPGLAEWLLKIQFAGGRWCPIDISGYGPALDPAARIEYRTAVYRRWAADPSNLSARDAAERLARWDRDIPRLIEVVGGDLRHAAQYGRLARALAEAGEPALARDWALRGLAAHPDDPPGAGLRAYLRSR